MNRGRLPSGKDQSAPAPHRDQSIRNNFANIMMQNQQQRPVVDDLPGNTNLILFGSVLACQKLVKLIWF